MDAPFPTTHEDARAIRVALLEDHASFREMVANLLRRTPGFRLAAVHASGEAALRAMPDAAPDVAVVDLELPPPGMSGIDFIRWVKLRWPQVQCLVLTNFGDTERVLGALQAGATGYLLKREPPACLLQAIREVAAGGGPMTPEIARRVLESLHDPAPAEPLTPREREVLQLARQGLTYHEIAEQLGITFDTVRTHFTNIYAKLQVHCRAEALRKVRPGHI